MKTLFDAADLDWSPECGQGFTVKGPDTRNWQIGDIILFYPRKRNRKSLLIIATQRFNGRDKLSSTCVHVAVYVGRGMMCHSNTKHGVHLTPVWGTLRDNFIRARRVDVPTFTPLDGRNLALEATLSIGRKYGWNMLPKLALPSIKNSKIQHEADQSFICSGLVNKSIERGLTLKSNIGRARYRTKVSISPPIIFPADAHNNRILKKVPAPICAVQL